MKKGEKQAFTLVELMVVITILVLMMILSYAPYQYMQQKAKLRIASREISQSLYEGKNFAISGVRSKDGNGDFVNSSIGIFFNKEEGKNHQVYFYTYPYSLKAENITSPDGGTLLKTKKLQDGVVIRGDSNILFFYEAISGNTSIWEINGSTKTELTENPTIEFSYKNSTNETLKKQIDYNPKTGTVNYK